jgi:hypothetical protein
MSKEDAELERYAEEFAVLSPEERMEVLRGLVSQLTTEERQKVIDEIGASSV